LFVVVVVVVEMIPFKKNLDFSKLEKKKFKNSKIKI